MGEWQEKTPREMVAEFYNEKLGRPPSQFEAGNVLFEEMDELAFAFDNPVGREAHLKELADVMYCLWGYAIARGWDLEEAFRLVHAANMTKARSITGKVQKGIAYVEPDLSGCV